MAAKKRRRAKKRAPGPKKKKRAIRKSKRRAITVRATATNPKKRRSSARRRVRRAFANPKRRRSGKRRHRRNPGIPPFAMAAMAALAGVASYVAANAGSYVATQHLDPTMVSVTRNRRIAGAVFAAAGVGLAALAKQPLIGAAVAAGGLVTLFGTEATVEVSKLLAKKSTGAVDQLGMGAVDMLGMGAVDSIGALDYALAPPY